MELDIFLALVLYEHIVVLSDVFEYHYQLYTGIEEACHLQEHIHQFG